MKAEGKKEALISEEDEGDEVEVQDGRNNSQEITNGVSQEKDKLTHSENVRRKHDNQPSKKNFPRKVIGSKRNHAPALQDSDFEILTFDRANGLNGDEKSQKKKSGKEPDIIMDFHQAGDKAKTKATLPKKRRL